MATIWQTHMGSSLVRFVPVPKIRPDIRRHCRQLEAFRKPRKADTSANLIPTNICGNIGAGFVSMEQFCGGIAQTLGTPWQTHKTPPAVRRYQTSAIMTLIMQIPAANGVADRIKRLILR